MNVPVLDSPRVLVDAEALPTWLRPLVDAVGRLEPEDLTFLRPPPEGGRASAVLVLLGEGSVQTGTEGGPDVLLLERAHSLRQHAGQPAFPGGAADDGDGDAIRTALREAEEEVGLDPVSVVTVATLPGLWLPPSGFVVVPVLAWWRSPHPVGVVDTDEVAAVHRIPLAHLTDPARRWTVKHPSGFRGPAFEVADLLVWGFTAGLLDRLLALSGFARPWDREDVRDLPDEVVEAAARGLDDPAAAARLAQAARQLEDRGVDVPSPAPADGAGP